MKDRTTSYTPSKLAEFERQELLGVVLRAKNSSGRNRLARHLQGEYITRGEAILAKCCDCMGYYADGMNDCEVPTCPLYTWMPYKK